MPMFKAKRIVQVYDKQDVCDIKEGIAILDYCTYSNEQVEMWIVKFLKNKKEVQRVFYKKFYSRYLELR